MTDHEALVSIIGAHLELCSRIYGSYKKPLPFTACFTCRYRGKDQCYYHLAADSVLEVIPQLDVFKRDARDE